MVVPPTPNVTIARDGFGTLFNADNYGAGFDPGSLSQDTWFIDGTLGSDTNSNTTSSGAGALKTFAELSRRWGQGQVINGSVPGANGNIIVNLANLGGLAGAGADPLTFDVVLGGGKRLCFVGAAPTTAPLTVTAVRQKNRATNTPFALTVTTPATSIGTRIVDTTLTAPDGTHPYFWGVKDETGGVLRISEPLGFPGLNNSTTSNDRAVAAMANTDTFLTQTLTQVQLGNMRAGWFRNSGARAAINFQDVVVVISDSTNFNLTAGIIIQYYGCGLRTINSELALDFIMNNCSAGYQNIGLFVLAQGSSLNFRGGMLLKSSTIGGFAFSARGSGLSFDMDCIVQSCSMIEFHRSSIAFGTCGIFDTPANSGVGGQNPAGSAIGISPGGSVGYTQGVDTTGALWGAGNAGYGVACSANSQFNYQSLTNLTVTGTLGDFSLGQNTATLYGIDPATGGYVGPTSASWTHLAAALGAGTGFGGTAINPVNQAIITPLAFT